MLQRALRRFNHYEVLGVSYDANNLNIKQAFYKLAKQYHPDASSEQTSEKFKEITEAYKVLSDPELRRLYDHKLESGQIPLRKEQKNAEEPREEDFKPDESPYQRAFMNVFDVERRNKLRERRKSTGEHLNDPMYRKSVLDFYSDQTMTYAVYGLVIMVFISPFYWAHVPKKDRELSDELAAEIEAIHSERNIKQNIGKI